MAIGVYRDLFPQFFRFSTVGVLGFFTNLASVYAFREGLGLYWAGAVSFIMAASVTWVANRTWTFRDRAHLAAPRQWAVYLCVNLVGFGFYFAVYGGLVALVPLCRLFPVLPIGAGSVAGLFSNFTLSHRLVFR